MSASEVQCRRVLIAHDRHAFASPSPGRAPRATRRVTALVALRRHGPAVQKVTARITFRNGAQARTLVAAAKRCARAAVVPDFAG